MSRWTAGAGAETISLAAHPGYAETELLRHQPLVMQFGSRLGAPLIGQNAAMGALPILRAATDPAAHGGEFYRPRWQLRGYPVLATPLPRPVTPKPHAGSGPSPRTERTSPTP